MKIRKIKVTTINGQAFTKRQLKNHEKEMIKLGEFNIEEYEKTLSTLV